jgi:hypothetical protein
MLVAVFHSLSHQHETYSAYVSIDIVRSSARTSMRSETGLDHQAVDRRCVRNYRHPRLTIEVETREGEAVSQDCS